MGHDVTQCASESRYRDTSECHASTHSSSRSRRWRVARLRACAKRIQARFVQKAQASPAEISLTEDWKSFPQFVKVGAVPTFAKTGQTWAPLYQLDIFFVTSFPTYLLPPKTLDCVGASDCGPWAHFGPSAGPWWRRASSCCHG